MAGKVFSRPVKEQLETVLFGLLGILEEGGDEMAERVLDIYEQDRKGYGALPTPRKIKAASAAPRRIAKAAPVIKTEQMLLFEEWAKNRALV